MGHTKLATVLNTTICVVYLRCNFGATIDVVVEMYPRDVDRCEDPYINRPHKISHETCSLRYLIDGIFFYEL